MTLSLYQLLVPLFALLMILKALSRFLRHQQTLRELLVWVIIWCGVSYISLFPDPSIQWLAAVTGIKSGINALIFFALVVLMYGFLKLYVKQEENERQLTELVRKIALQDLTQKGSDKRK